MADESNQADVLSGREPRRLSGYATAQPGDCVLEIDPCSRAATVLTGPIDGQGVCQGDRAQLTVETLKRKIEDYPNGYPMLAAFQSSDSAFSMYQPTFEESWLNMDETLIKAREIAAFDCPDDRDYNSVMSWVNNWKPLVMKEWYSLLHKADMCTFFQYSESTAGLDGMVETMLVKLDCAPVRWIFQPRDLLEKTTDQNVHYFDGTKVKVVVALLVTFFIFILLVLPVILLYQLTSTGGRSSTSAAIGVLVAFLFIFTAAMSLLTNAKRHELVAASAAYCAVLGAFISNFSGSNDGPAT